MKKLLSSRAFLALLVALAFAPAARAAQLGDPAAPLKIKTWIKGSPVEVNNGKGIYVVEFWATWCPPCRTTIPHLTELQTKFKKQGVTFIGVTDEDEDVVKPFVEKMGDKMDYAVACDDSRATFTGYLQAYEQRSIPYAFIVAKSGAVIWHGSPMSGLEEALGQIVAGKYDLAALKRAHRFAANLTDYQELARDSDERAPAKARQLLDDAGKDPDLLCQLAIGIVADLRNRKRDFALAQKAIAAAEAATPKPTHKILHAKAVVLFESGHPADAIRTEKSAIAACDDDKTKTFYERVVKFFEERQAD